jgi:ABC-2 type transport system permease protein
VVPFAGDDPVGATFATASMVTFAVMISSLFSYGWVSPRIAPSPGIRTGARCRPGLAPASPGAYWPGVVMTFVSLVPVVAIAAIATEATTPPLRLALAAGAVLVVALPFTLMGLAIGYALPPKAALAVAQVIFFPLAFDGGLLSAPGQAPGWVEVIASYLPTRGDGRAHVVERR